MIQVVIIRHGRTEWNRIERFRGRADIDLDEVGKKQAEATAKRVAESGISAIYASPLRRTMTTARIISEHLSLAVQPLPGIMDIDYGKWQGLTPEEAAARDASLYKLWREHPHMVTFPDGESLEDVRNRASEAIENVLEQADNKTIAVVSHKVVCQLLILHFIALSNSHFWQIGQDVAAVNLFHIREGVSSAVALNDTCHLKGLTVS
ncbi:MAG: histidine phosphatase family protein [Dehalococcoidia bacterium]